MGRQPAVALGVVHARATGRSGSPRGCRGCRPGWSTTCSSTSWPTCWSPATTRRSGPGSTATRSAERAKGYLLGWSAAAADGAAARATTRTERRRGRRPAATASVATEVGPCRRVGQGVDRPPAHVERLLADRVAARRRARRRGTARRGGARRRAGRRTARRARRGAPAPGRVEPSMPDSSAGLARRGRDQGGSPGSQWPPNWNHARAFACRVSSTRGRRRRTAPGCSR